MPVSHSFSFCFPLDASQVSALRVVMVLIPLLPRIKEFAVHRRNRLNEANTMHQFLRDIDDEEAWIK